MTGQRPGYPDAPRRARLVKETHRHRCDEELAALGDPYIGSVAECSCGKQFIRAEDQRDGRYWSALSPEKYHTPTGRS